MTCNEWNKDVTNKQSCKKDQPQNKSSPSSLWEDRQIPEAGFSQRTILFHTQVILALYLQNTKVMLVW